MSATTLGVLLTHALVLCVVISFIVFFLNPRRHLNVIFLFMSLSFAFWMFSDIGFLKARDVKEAQQWARLFSIWNITVSLLLHFVLVFTQNRILRKKTTMYAAIYLPGMLFCVLGIWKSVMMGTPVPSSYGWALTNPHNPVYFAGVIWACSIAIVIVLLMYRYYLSTRDPLRKKQVKYVAIGFLFPIFFGVSSSIVSLWTGAWAPELTTFPFVFTSMFIGFAIWKYRLFALTPAVAADNIISTMTDGLLIVNDDGMIQTVNKALCRMLGYSEQELTGLNVDDLFADEKAERPISDKTWFYAMFSAGNISDIQTSFITKTKTIVPISLSASILKDRGNTMHGMVFVCRDITERKIAQEALVAAHDELEIKVAQRTAQLEQANEHLAVTLASIGDGVITTDISGRIMLVNKVAGQLLGPGAQQAEGRPLDDCLYIASGQTKRRLENPISQIMKTQGIVTCEDGILLHPKDGTRRSISTIAAPIRDTGDHIIGMVLVLHDMTEHKTMENELFKARKLESMGVLAAGIASDFGGILSEMVTHLFTAKLHLKAGDEAYRHITEAEAATFRAGRLTKQLLTFSKGGSPVKERTSIRRLVEDSVGFCLSGSSVNYRLDLPDDLLPVEIDRGQLDQAISNLVVNADQAMKQGGTIVVSAQNTVIDESSARLPSHLVHASQLEAGTYVCLSITDEGPGIPAENLEKIFDPYFTTKENRNGLGLTAAYSIVKKHNGYITVDSIVGKGTTFCVYLPAAAEEPEDKKGDVGSAGVTEGATNEED